MDIDNSKFTESCADERLEKPFNIDALRDIVKKHVPKTTSQVISKYLSFPDMPKFEEAEKPENIGGLQVAPPVSIDEMETKNFRDNIQSNDEAPPATPAATPPSAPDKKEGDELWNMESFDEINNYQNEAKTKDFAAIDKAIGQTVDDEKLKDDNDIFSMSTQEDSADDDFQQVPLKSMSSADETPSSSSNENDFSNDDLWVKEDLSQFNVDEDILNQDVPKAKIPEIPQHTYQTPDQTSEPISEPAAEEDYGVDAVESFESDFHTMDQSADPSHVDHDAIPMIPQEASLDYSQMDQKMIEKIIDDKVNEKVSEKMNEIIEDVVWKVVPELAKQIIEKELNKLLSEDEN